MAPPVTLADGRAGPHPSFVELARPFVFEARIQKRWKSARVASSDETKIRLQAIAWIDSVRKHLRLPVRTYNTAAIYYMKFRLMYPDFGSSMDAAAAALFAACKIEDTLKRSREILCTAYNLKASPAERLQADDASFELHSKTIIGLERLMLEASGFDFRNRHPQRQLLKILKFYNLENTPSARLAYRICLDLYRTLAPLKQTTSAMAMASLELAMRLNDTLTPQIEGGAAHDRLHVDRGEIMETLLDMLDLYTDRPKGSIVGLEFTLDAFLSIRIGLNKAAESKNIPRFATSQANQVNGSKQTSSSSADTPSSPRREARHESRDGTVRFVLDARQAKQEQDAVAEYFTTEQEEYTVQISAAKR